VKSSVKTCRQPAGAPCGAAVVPWEVVAAGAAAGAGAGAGATAAGLFLLGEATGAGVLARGDGTGAGGFTALDGAATVAGAVARGGAGAAGGGTAAADVTGLVLVRVPVRGVVPVRCCREAEEESRGAEYQR